MTVGFWKGNTRQGRMLDRCRAIAPLLLAALALAPAERTHAAAYATAGSGQYRNEILWLTWGGGTNGTHNVVLANGNSTSATLTLATGIDLDVTCALGSIAGNTVRSYRPGNFGGDALDDLYSIGGTGTANALISGIYVQTGAAATFTITCSATVGGQVYRIPGIVMADAESMNTGGTIDAPAEVLQSTASGEWNVVEMNRVPGRTYYARLTQPTATTQTLRIGPGGEGTGTSPAALAFLTFNNAAYAGANQQVVTNFLIDGGGNTAIAIGLLVPNADFGDAPASYGAPIHLIESLTTNPDGLAANGTSVDVNAAAFTLGALRPPTGNFVGTTGPDTELSTPHGATALGDNSVGIAGAAEEDGFAANLSIPRGDPAATLARTVACNGAGTVAGWIDFDRNGAFDPDERAQAACSAGSAALTWVVPADAQFGASFARLRYATTANAAQLALATGRADSGEVEDHAIRIGIADLQITKTNTPAAGPNDQAGDTLAGGAPTTYTMVVTNNGPDTVVNPTLYDPQPTGTSGCSGATCAVTRGTATCPPATGAALVTALQTAPGVTIPSMGNQSDVTFTLTCAVP